MHSSARKRKKTRTNRIRKAKRSLKVKRKRTITEARRCLHPRSQEQLQA